MSITIELSPAEESELRVAAAQEGQDFSSFIRQRLFATGFSMPPLLETKEVLADLAFGQLLAPEAVERLAETILPDLCRNQDLRRQLNQWLHANKVEQSHPVYDLLAEAEEWARWETAGHTAATTATERLVTKKIGYVYGRNGSVYRRLTDGTEQALPAEEMG